MSFTELSLLMPSFESSCVVKCDKPSIYGQEVSIFEPKQNGFWRTPCDSAAFALVWPPSADTDVKRRLNKADLELMSEDFTKFLKKHFGKHQKTASFKPKQKIPGNVFNELCVEENTLSDEIKAALMKVATPKV